MSRKFEPFEFVDERNVVYCIECLPEVNKKASHKLIIFKQSCYVMKTKCQSHGRAVGRTEGKLIANVVRFESRTQAALCP